MSEICEQPQAGAAGTPDAPALEPVTRKALLDAVDKITASAASAPAATDASPVVKTIARTRVTALNTKTGAKTESYLGPNLFNILMWLLNWREEHKADAADYVLSVSEAVGKCAADTPMAVDALISEYQDAVVTFKGIRDQLTDTINELMQKSTLASIGLNVVFIHPQRGPIGLTMMSSNAFIDNPEVIGACEDIMMQSMANALQQRVEQKRAQKKKGGELILPSKKIITPR